MYYIYLIVNKVNGKTYIGQRKSSKQCYLDSYMGSGKHLKAAKAKYGIENFEKFLIQYCYSKEETNKAEKFWIAEYRRRGKAEYNITDGGDGGNGGSNKGRHFSEEHRKKISESHKGRHFSEEHRKKISESHKGKYLSEEAKKKISEANKGKHRTEESRKKMSEALKGKSTWNKGKHFSEEIKKKISESHKGMRKGMHWKLVDGKRVWY